MITPEIEFDTDVFKNYIRRPETLMSAKQKKKRTKCILPGKPGFKHVLQAAEHETTLDVFSRLVPELEKCRKIIASKKEGKKEEFLNTCIDHVDEIWKALNPEEESGLWVKIKYTSVGADLIACMREAVRLIEEEHDWMKTQHRIGDVVHNFARHMRRLCNARLEGVEDHGW
jgi:hypothetical protein